MSQAGRCCRKSLFVSSGSSFKSHWHTCRKIIWGDSSSGGNSLVTSVVDLRAHRMAIAACFVFRRKISRSAFWDFFDSIGQKRSFPNRSGRERAIPGAPSGAQANQSISGPGAALRRPLATEQRPFVRERNGHRSFIDRPVEVGEQPMIATPDGRASRRHVAATDLSGASPSGKRSRSAAAPLSRPAPWQGA
jgi:hypothetical protein